MNIKSAIARIIDQQDLSRDEAFAVMMTIMNGEATPAQIGAYLTGLRMKGETVDEVAGSAMAMREHATRIHPRRENLVDTCGTGGDGKHTFNISTAAAFVAAGAGVPIAKHGNRAASSKCGSADVLEKMGVRISAPPALVEDCINAVGIGFLFAQTHHPAMKNAVGPRREIAVRTLFNFLGPLTNPAGAKRQVIGVSDPAWGERLAQVLARLGAEHVLVVASEDGLDEISNCAATHLWELKDGIVKQKTLQPGDFGMKIGALADLLSADSEEGAAIFHKVLDGEESPRADIVILNAAAAIVVGGLAQDLGEGVELARQSIQSGAAREKLESLIAHSNKAEA